MVQFSGGRSVGIILIQWGLPAFGEYLKSQKPEDAFQALLNILFLMFFIPFLLSFFMLHKGKKILKVGKFPLPGTKVIKDTQVLEGELARRRAHIIIGLSLILGVGSLSGAAYFPYALKKAFYSKQIVPKSNNGRQMGSVSLSSTPPLRP